MPRTSVRSYASRYGRGARRQLQWTETRARRDAAVALVRSLPKPISGSGVEFKSIDLNDQTMDVNTTPHVFLLNGCARGPDINQRDGREIIMRSVQLRYHVGVTSGTGVGQFARVLVVYDRQTNAADIDATDVLSSATIYGTRHLDNRKRFTILYDRTHQLNAATESGSEVFQTYYRRLRHPVSFNSGDAATVACMVSGSLYLITIGNIDPGTTDAAMIFSSRVRFTEQ